MFQKQHFRDTADLIGALDVEEETRHAIARLFENFFAESNPKFDPKIWERRIEYAKSDRVG